MGAMFARRPGRADVPPIAFGSHLDTQPTGGKFDGVLGVLGALEALRTLVEAGYETFAPIEVVNWTNEEGARFSPAMTSSGVFAGAFDRAWAVSRQDRSGETFGAALEAIGYRGAESCGAHPLSAFFELHIEQGPILEAEAKDIGIVTGVQGMRWYEGKVVGQDAHTGATPMHLRKNALLGAARLIARIDAIAHEHAPDAVGAVGLIENRPNSRNVVPGEVFFTVDFRHPDDKVLDVIEGKFRAALPEILEPMKLTYKEARIWDSPAVKFAPELIACVRAGAEKAGFKSRDMISGAGHDAAYVARVAPTTMIFVPCAGGISHNEAESTSFDECAAGAQVLLNAVLEYDRKLG
jgi:N-carbamoyl-L-amino-acid hydrolase